MPDAGITPANLKPLRGPWPNSAMCSFIQDNCGEEQSSLFAGQLYHSRSVLFLPGFFNELESRYPTEFARLFEAFAEPWHEEAASAICRTLRRLSEERARELYWEGHRRSDMIRFGKFTGSSYKWSWKGGALRGRSIPDYRKVYAIPTKFVPTLGQNEGY